MSERTFWNGVPALCEKTSVTVGPSEPGWWCAKFTGTVRAAVKVTVDGRSFYLDNESGNAWLKVTDGKGHPNIGHLSLPNSSTEVPQ